MRKYLLAFLMLLMVMPGLACGPFMGAGTAEAAQVSMSGMSGMPDCSGMELSGRKNASSNGDRVFFKDCAKVHLSGVDHARLKAPDLGGTVFLIAWVAVTADYGFTPPKASAIHGPPPDWPGLSETRPSILLITRRLRV